MSNAAEAPRQNRVIDLKAGAHMMVLDAGIFCIFHAAGQDPAGPSGLPGVRISRAPGTPPGIVTVSTFEEDGWIGGSNGAALVRVMRGPAAVLVTTYQEPDSAHAAPRLQVAQLAGPVSAAPAQPAAVQAPVAAKGKAAATAAEPVPEKVSKDVAAHIQRRGDVTTGIGQWMGVPGSQSWIEGFSVAPEEGVPASDIEYQAVLGKGWLSPWAEGGQYCGSRGMALPILGLRVRLKGKTAKTLKVRLTATFTDGTRLGPTDGAEALEAESLAPLEAFLLEFVPVSEKIETPKPTAPKAAAPKAAKETPAKAAPKKPASRSRTAKADDSAPAKPAAPKKRKAASAS